MNFFTIFMVSMVAPIMHLILGQHSPIAFVRPSGLDFIFIIEQHSSIVSFRPKGLVHNSELQRTQDCSNLKGFCGQECYKGPGDICGGLGDQYGVCGEGLVCSSCNRCIGCSYNSFTCFDDHECLTEDNVWLSVGFWLGIETLIFIT